MTKQFIGTGRPVISATIVDIPNDQFLFAQNGELKKIFCHRNQGGYPTVTPHGTLVLTGLGSIETPKKGTEIVLVRESANPNTPGYTRAWGWALKADWDEVAWAVHANTTFKAMASGHRHGGKFQGNTQTEVELVKGTLINIIKEYPRRHDHDPLSPGYKTRAGGITFSQDEVTWYRLDTDKTWVKTSDPRPMN